MAQIIEHSQELKRKAAGWLDTFSAIVIGCCMLSPLAAGQATPTKTATPTKVVTPTKALVVPSAPEKGQKTFSSAQEACKALLTAMQNDDVDAQLKILGASAKELITSGDPTEDMENKVKFIEKYQQMHRLLTEPNGFTTLFIGAENWPSPIPLTHKGKEWYFDTAAGKKEILFRRIGQNELTILELCDELVAAEKEYYAQPHDGDKEKQYAQKLMSDPGKHNGLYWEVKAGEPESPLGPFVAAAEQEGYVEDASQKHEPYHGYYFRVLKEQGPRMQGGEMSYVVDGKMTRGFAFLAYPAEYKSSGVMTFLVDQDGIVYEKDLGPKTDEIVKTLRKYDPGPSWKKAAAELEQTLSQVR